jgi:hypothetical protein
MEAASAAAVSLTTARTSRQGDLPNPFDFCSRRFARPVQYRAVLEEGRAACRGQFEVCVEMARR